VTRAKAVEKEAPGAETDGQGDLEHGHVGAAEEVLSPLDPACPQIAVGSGPEGSGKSTAEVSGGGARRAGEGRDVERFAVARVDKVAGTEEVAGGGNHAPGWWRAGGGNHAPG
jgi:hypothetical protein